MHGSQLLLWAARYFFSKILTYRRAYSGVKVTLCSRALDRNHDISRFFHRTQGKWGSQSYTLSKALIIFKFCTRIVPTEREVLPCASTCSNVLIPIYQGAEVRSPLILHASVSRTTISIIHTLASFCSTGGNLQMVSISSVPSKKKVMSIRRSFY